METKDQSNQLDARFFTRIFDALGTSASLQEFASAATMAVVETLGDWCALWLSDRDTGEPRLAGAHHRDAEKLNVIRELASNWPSKQQYEISNQAASLTQSHIYMLEKEEQYRKLFGSEYWALIAKQAGTSSLILIPLLRGIRRLGLLAIASSDHQFASTGNHFTTANEMARHITTAIAQLQQIDLTLQTSQQLTFTSLRLQAILEGIPQGIIVIDSRDGHIAFANNSFYRLLGLPENARTGNLVQTALPRITCANGWAYSPEEIPWIRSMRTSLPTLPEEIVVHHPDGRELTILCNASPIRNERGSAVGTVALLQDISERKKFEQQKDEFLAMVAHELRTPLTALKGYIQILLRRITREPNLQFGEREVNMLQVVDRQVSRFSRLIFQLLDFSRIQAGRLELNPTCFSLGELVRCVVAQQQVAAPDRIISLEEKDEIAVCADQDRVEQVLNNLISNAIKATKSGGEITVNVDRWDEWVTVSITDNGIGMVKEAQEHLFERLYRGPGNSHEGMGLGLYISKGVIDAHGGEIWFESEPGKGSVFQFTLPVPRE